MTLGLATPFFLYRNSLDHATSILAKWKQAGPVYNEATASGFSTDPLSDRIHWTGPWKSTAQPVDATELHMRIVTSRPTYADALAITGHNLHERNGCTVSLAVWGTTDLTPDWTMATGTWDQLGTIANFNQWPPDMTVLEPFSSAETRRALGTGGYMNWLLIFTLVSGSARVLTMNTLGFGEMLQFPEGFASGIDKGDYKLVSRSKRSRGGSLVQIAMDHVQQEFKFKWGPAGLDDDFVGDQRYSSPYPVGPLPVSGVSDTFTRADEDPLASPWRNIFTGGSDTTATRIKLLGNLATNNGYPLRTFPGLCRSSTHDVDGLTSGDGWVEAKVRVNGSGNTWVGVLARTPSYVFAGNDTTPWLLGGFSVGEGMCGFIADAGIGSSSSGVTEKVAFTAAINTWYTVRMECEDRTFRLWIDGILRHTMTVPTPAAPDIYNRWESVASSTVSDSGIGSYNYSGTEPTTDWDDYQSGRRRVTTAPTWSEFLSEYWSRALPWWFGWDGDRWYCFNESNSKVSMSHSSPFRREIDFEFACLVENMMVSH